MDTAAAHQASVIARGIDLDGLRQFLVGPEAPARALAVFRCLVNMPSLTGGDLGKIAYLDAMMGVLLDNGLSPMVDVSGVSVQQFCVWEDLTMTLMRLQREVNPLEDPNVFFSACEEGNIPMLRLCLDSGYGIDHADSRGFTGLLLAAHCLRLDVLEFLQGKGANLHALTHLGQNALHCCLAPADYISIHPAPALAIYLAGQGVDGFQPDCAGVRPCDLALEFDAKWGKDIAARVLIEHEAKELKSGVIASFPVSARARRI